MLHSFHKISPSQFSMPYHFTSLITHLYHFPLCDWSIIRNSSRSQKYSHLWILKCLESMKKESKYSKLMLLYQIVKYMKHAPLTIAYSLSPMVTKSKSKEKGTKQKEKWNKENKKFDFLPYAFLYKHWSGMVLMFLSLSTLHSCSLQKKLTSQYHN